MEMTTSEMITVIMRIVIVIVMIVIVMIGIGMIGIGIGVEVIVEWVKTTWREAMTPVSVMVTDWPKGGETRG